MYVLVACYSVLDPFGEIRTQLQETRTRSRFVLVVDSIQWRCEDRPMGWFIDPYRFVQWRPDGNSVPKQRQLIMWVFVLLHFLIYRCRYALHVTLIISCDFLLYCTSLITCTTSWDICDCSPYLRSWYGLVSASFHVLVACRCWLRPSFDIP